MNKLNAQKRDASENTVEIRKDGFVPGVFYGPKEESTPIKVSEPEFIKMYEEAGESTIIALNDGDTEHQSLIHDVQFDAITGKPIHVDFYVIEKGKKVEVKVPLSFVGVSPAEKTLGGVLVKVMHDIAIKALPTNLPHEIEADITPLETFESQLKVSDIKLPEGVELNEDDLEAVVALVQEPKEEVEEEAPASIDDIEVEEKGKKEESADAGEGESK
jgi:large subunit ribosomal protein L25